MNSGPILVWLVCQLEKTDSALKESMYHLDIYKKLTVKLGAEMVSREKQATAECWGHTEARGQAPVHYGKKFRGKA